uniref:Hemicentin-1-like n=1 Tax=Saccoglossus kowalevskii TaxID=10224 RepID=A0ABM0LUR4_SACKO|nr:PREDICTED: hemicentin-1-like [Saccoglossus kowalevskii]
MISTNRSFWFVLTLCITEAVFVSAIPPRDDFPECLTSGINYASRPNQVGNSARVSCDSRGGADPLPTLVLMRGTEVLNGTREDDDRQELSRISYAWQMSWMDNGATITCQETHPELPEPRYCEIEPMRVSHPPVIFITPDDIIQVSMGQSLTLTCEAIASPGISDIEWRFDDSTDLPDELRYEITTDTELTLTITNFQPSDLLYTLSCWAKNTKGRTSHVVELVDLSYPLPDYPKCTSTDLDVNDYYYTDTYNKRWTSTYSLTLDKDDNGITFTCTETHPRLYFPRTCTIGPINVQYMPIVTLNPTSKEAGIGDTVFSTCTATGNPLPSSVQWYFNGVTMVPDTRYVVSSSASTSSLTIYGLQRKDFDQSITCRATNTIGTRTVYFSLTSEPTTTIPTTTVSDSIPYDGFPDCTYYPNSLILIEGTTVSLQCESRGGDVPSELTWAQDTSPITGLFSIDLSNKIWINTYDFIVTQDDNGAIFICSESHPNLPDIRTCTIGPLNIQYKPVVTVDPEIYQASLGDTVSFYCQAFSNPLAMVQWYVNGVPQLPYRYTASSGTLTINNVKQSDVNNMIRCHATNTIGTTFKEVRLLLSAVTTIPTTTQDLDIPYPNYPQCSIQGLNTAPSINIVGSQIEITCESRGGNTPPQLVWKQSGGELDASCNNNIASATWTCTHIRTLKRSDNNVVLTCEETHPQLQQTRSCYIGPLNVVYPPFLVINPQQVEARNGELLIFTCVAEGNPRITNHEWYFNGETTNPDPARYTINSDSGILYLTIYNVQHGDALQTISCRASNQYGTTSTNIRIDFLQPTMLPTTTEEGSDKPIEGYPVCTTSGILSQMNIAGTNVSITCESRGGSEPSQLRLKRWNVDLEAEINNDLVNSIWQSSFAWTLDWEDNGALFSCRETHPNLAGERICTIGPLNVGYSPKVTIEPRSMQANLGDVISATCSVISHPSVTSLKWLFNGETTLPDSDRYIISETNSIVWLTIMGIQRSDFSITIMCAATNSISTTLEPVLLQPAFTVTSEAPVIVTMPTEEPTLPNNPSCSSDGIRHGNQPNMAGDTVVIMCQYPSGYQSPELDWFRNDELLEINSVLDYVNNVWTKQYRWVLSPQDNRMIFTCKLTHPGLSESGSCQIGPINVEFAPIITISPIEITVVFGQNVVFQCESEGNPQPLTYLWTFDGDSRIPDNARYSTTLHEGGIMLSIQNVNQEDVLKNIACEAGNQIGITVAFIHMEILQTMSTTWSMVFTEKLSTTPSQYITGIKPPDSGYPLCTADGIRMDNTPNIAGSTVGITCESRGGYPAPNLEFKRTGEILNSSLTLDSGNNRWKITYEWELSSLDNYQTITCSESHPSRQRPRTCSIGPIIVAHPPTVLVDPQVVVCKLGMKLLINCKASGNPSQIQQIRWLFDGTDNVPDPDRFFRSTDQQYIWLTIIDIEEIDFSYRISCQARNSVGSSTVNVHLIPPANITIPTRKPVITIKYPDTGRKLTNGGTPTSHSYFLFLFSCFVMSIASR